MAAEEGQPLAPQIIIEPSQMAGVWANVVSISQTEHEFTLDFIRMDATAPPPGRGIVVARVAFSPLLASQLSELLMGAWQRYAHESLKLGEPHDEPPESTQSPEA
jgi:hypothetical protein